jgi:cytosine/creatinine deaminase
MTTIPDVPSRFAAPTDLVLSRATTASGERVDVLLRGGRVATVTPAGARAFDTAIAHLDLDGFVLLAAPAEPHAHLDKALTWESLATGHVDLPGAIDAWSRASRHLDLVETQDRALRAIIELVSHGVTAVRTHADVCPGDHPLAAVEALAGLRDATAGVVDLQIALLSRANTPDDVIRGAVDAGADLIGGAPYMEDDPATENARLLRLASELCVGVDLHVDEELDASVASLGDLARRVVDVDFPFAVTASHCVSLGIQDPVLVAGTIAAMVTAGVRVVTLPLTNLYLMGRGWETSPPRGLTAIRQLLDAGVTAAAGGDNIRDPFNPLGRADPLATASLLVTAGHVSVTEAYDAVSVNARKVLGLPRAGVAPGLVADLLAVRAVSLDDAIARTPDDRIVIGAGRVIAATETTRRTALDESQ